MQLFESFQHPKMKVFSGMIDCYCIFDRATEDKITLEATGKGLKKGALIIENWS